MSSNVREIQIKELRDALRVMQESIRSLEERVKRSEAARKEEQERFQKEKEALEKENKNLKEQVDYLTKKLFGRSSEKGVIDIPGQLSLFNEAEMLPEPTPEQLAAEQEASTQEKPKTRRSKTTQAEKFKGLPVRKEYLDIPEDQRICPECGSQMKEIGETFVRREFNYIPGRAEIIEYYSKNYECPECRKTGASKIIRGKDGKAHMLYGMASSATVAWVMYQKYANGLPLYRQEADFKRNGIPLDRAVLASWVIRNADAFFMPVYDHLHWLLLQRHFAMADETPFQVLHEPERRAQSKSYFWVFRSGEDGGAPIVLYKYSETRNGDNAMEFLKGFTGYLMTDGYQGYNKVRDVRRCACYAHIRRYLIDAIPKGQKSNYSLPAVQGYLYIEKIFNIEKSIKAKANEDFDRIREERLKQEKPVIEAFLAWLDQQKPDKGSRFATAVTYIQNRRPYLMTYLEDGRCSLSNNWSENSVRPVVIGRKNFLFSDTPKGADASAAVYTITELAKANNVNAYHYLMFLLDRCPVTGTSHQELEALMPWNEGVKKEIDRRIEEAKKGHSS